MGNEINEKQAVPGLVQVFFELILPGLDLAGLDFKGTGFFSVVPAGY